MTFGHWKKKMARGLWGVSAKNKTGLIDCVSVWASFTCAEPWAACVLSAFDFSGPAVFAFCNGDLSGAERSSKTTCASTSAGHVSGAATACSFFSVEKRTYTFRRPQRFFVGTRHLAFVEVEPVHLVASHHPADTHVHLGTFWSGTKGWGKGIGHVWRNIAS